MAKKKNAEPRYIKRLPAPFNKMRASDFEALPHGKPEYTLEQKASFALFTAKKYTSKMVRFIVFSFVLSLLCLGYAFYSYLIQPSPLLIASYPDGQLICVTANSTKDQGIRQRLNAEQTNACNGIEALRGLVDTDDGSKDNGDNHAK